MAVSVGMAGAAIVALALLLVAARRAVTVCAAEVRGGRLIVRRGGLAPRILADLGDVVQRPPITRAALRIVRDRGLAKVEIRGEVSPAQAQQIRNVIGSVPLAKLVNATKRR
jgi:hypothetical protein